MEDTDHSSESEEDFDQEELEVALYSQTHFDAGPCTGADATTIQSDSGLFTYNRVTQPFRVGVRELPTRVTQLLSKQPSDLGSFIAFSRESDSDGSSGEDKTICVKGEPGASSLFRGAKNSKTGTEISSKKESSHDTKNSKTGTAISSNKREPSHDTKNSKTGTAISSNKKEPSHDTKNSKTGTAISSNKKEPSKVKENPETDRDKHLLLQALKKENERCRTERETVSIAASPEIEQEPQTFGSSNAADPHAGRSKDTKTSLKPREQAKAVTSEAKGQKGLVKNKNGKDKKTPVVPSSSTPAISEATTKGEREEKLLPFQITKKPKSPNLSRAIVVDDIDEEIIDLSEDSPEKGTTAKEAKKKSESKLPKLKDFLELPKSDGGGETSRVRLSKHKSKFLSKAEAAVMPRKPQVQVRRPPPPAVPVRYHRQDSDTDTDYSDSDRSSLATPTKKVKDRAATSVPKKVSADSESDDDDDDDDHNDELGQDVAVPEIIVSGDDEPEERPSAVVSDSDGSESASSSGDDDSNVEDAGSDDSDSSAAVLVDDGSAPALSGLDFNLTGGVSKLLSGESAATETPKADNNWKIDEKDRYNIPSLTSRYFAPRPIQCRNCRKDGHLSRDCPEPLKRRCIYCGEEGHQFKSCPQAVCYNCNAPGHRTTDCPEPKMDWNAMCDRCWMTGHREEMCPDKWRQLHVSLNPGKLRLFKLYKGQEKNPRVYCYNCGKKGHLGYECRLQRMNRFVAASYPFIARCDRYKYLTEISLPAGVTAGELRRDAKLEGKRRGLERKMERKGDCFSDHKRSKLKAVREALEQNRQSIANRLRDEEREREREPRAGLHIHPAETDKRGHKRNARDKLPKTKSVTEAANIKRPRVDTPASTDLRFRDRPSTSRSVDRYDRSAVSAKSSRSSAGPPRGKRKRNWDNDDVVEITDSDHDSLEDMAAHQVSNNEWWLAETSAGDKGRTKKRKRVRKKKRQTSPAPLPVEDHYDGDRRHHSREDERDFERQPFERNWDRRTPPSSSHKPKTLFVYTNRQHTPSFTEEPSFPSRRSDHRDSPSVSTDAPHFYNHSEHSQSRARHHQYSHDTDRSPPRATKFRKHSKSPGNSYDGVQSSGKAHHSGDKGSGKAGAWFGETTRGKRGKKQSGAEEDGFKQPASWPAARSRRKKVEPAPHSGGFRARHERFVSMKNDCDIKVNMRR